MGKSSSLSLLIKAAQQVGSKNFPLFGQEMNGATWALSYRATYIEIETNDFNLNIPRYVDTFEEEEPIDIDAVQGEIDALKQELVAVRRQMSDKLSQLKMENTNK